MRILMVNRTTELVGDTERIMYQLADSLTQLGHEVCFFAAEDPRPAAAARRRTVKKATNWEELLDPLQALRNRKRGKTSVTVEQLTEREPVYTAPPRTAAYSTTYLVQPEKPDLFHMRRGFSNASIEGHMIAFLRETPVDAALVFDIYGSLTWSVVSVLKDFQLPVWVMMTGMQPLCPAGDCLLHGHFHCTDCHLCGRHNSPRDEKRNEKDEHASVRPFLPCLRHRCIDQSRFRSLLAVREQKYLREFQYYDLPDGYMTMSVYHQRKMVEADFTSREIISIDVPLAPSAFEGMHRARSGYMIYIGDIAREHGVELMIRAMAMSISSEDLVLCGEGPDMERVEELADELNVRERLHMMGTIKPLTLRKLMAEASCLIVPSLCEENAPWGLLEMQAMGKPAIAADYGVLSDRVIDHRSGLLFEAGNAADLAQCMDEIHDMSDEALRRLGDNSAEDARRRYDPVLYAKRVLSLLSGESGTINRKKASENS